MLNLSRFSLEGKIALITGGSQGIGRATALGFADAGAMVVVASRKLSELEKVVADIQANGGKAMAVAANTGRLNEIDALVRTVVDKYGRIDILVNNAATSPAFTTILDAEERLYDAVMNLNVKGLYFITQAVARVMKDNGGGSIINVASVDGFIPQNKVGIYSISKAAVNMLTKSAAVELAPFNIRVNGIAPGSIRSRLFDALFAHLSPEDAEAELRTFEDRFPVRRVGVPDDIVGGMIYLASGASQYTTGETIVIDGGCLQVSALND
jgi:NAD(P)-dependent dehydrogenase (short-subunit alcohol dehydrogenase family)